MADLTPDQIQQAREIALSALTVSDGCLSAVVHLLARYVLALAQQQPTHEWQCPACGATTCARMADHYIPRTVTPEYGGERTS